MTNAYASPFEDFGRHVDDWMDAMRTGVRQAVTYTDTVIIPEVRHESGSALRTLAIHMERWADKLDPQGMRQR